MSGILTRGLLGFMSGKAHMVHTPKGSKYPNVKYSIHFIPQVIITIPKAETADTPCLGALDLQGLGAIV